MKTPQIKPLAGMSPLGVKPSVKSSLGELSAVCAGQSMAGDIVDSHGDVIASGDDVRHLEELVEHHNQFAALNAVAKKLSNLLEFLEQYPHQFAVDISGCEEEAQKSLSTLAAVRGESEGGK